MIDPVATCGGNKKDELDVIIRAGVRSRADRGQCSQHCNRGMQPKNKGSDADSQDRGRLWRELVFLGFDREKWFSPMGKKEKAVDAWSEKHTQEGCKHGPSWKVKGLNPVVASLENYYWRSLEPAYLNSWQGFTMHLGFHLRSRRERMKKFKRISDSTICNKCVSKAHFLLETGALSVPKQKDTLTGEDIG